MSQQETTIEPHDGGSWIDLREVVRFRDTFVFLVWRNVKGRYSQAVIGVGWAVVQPLFSMLVFTVVFGRLAKVPSDGMPYAIFSFAALVPWTFFSNAVLDATASLIANAGMISKIYIPRIILPLAAVAAKLVDFGIAFILLLAGTMAYGITPGAAIVCLPVAIVTMAMAATGAGLWFAALAVRYRDVSYSMGFMLQLLMYSAPVVYPASLVPEQYRLAYALNPMVGVIEGFRAAVLNSQPVPWSLLLIGFATSALMLLSGAIYFTRKESFFADLA